MGEYKPIPRTASHLFPAPVLPYTRSVAESSGRSVKTEVHAAGLRNG